VNLAFLCERESRRIRRDTPRPLHLCLHTSHDVLLPFDDTQLESRNLKQASPKMTSPSSKVLVYHHHHNATNPIVADGLAVMTTSELDDIVASRKYSQDKSFPLAVELPANLFLADPDLQRTSKPIPRGVLGVEIYERDLLTDAQKPQFAAMPNYQANVAGVTIPIKVLLGKLMGSKELDYLVILSAKR